MKSSSGLLLLFLVAVVHSEEVYAAQITPGAGLYSGVVSWPNYIRITPSRANEFSLLGNCFTIQLWFLDKTSGPGVQNLMNLHPNNGLDDYTKSHFDFTLKRTTVSSVLEVRVGCGTGIGYSIVADLDYKTDSAGHQWNHVTLKVDGDGSTSSNIAKVYINGVLKTQGEWNNNECRSRPVFWYGTGREVHIGHYHTLNQLYRFEGLVDELSFWNSVDRPIDSFIETLDPSNVFQEPSLQAYFKFNEGPQHRRDALWNLLPQTFYASSFGSESVNLHGLSAGLDAATESEIESGRPFGMWVNEVSGQYVSSVEVWSPKFPAMWNYSVNDFPPVLAQRIHAYMLPLLADENYQRPPSTPFSFHAIDALGRTSGWEWEISGISGPLQTAIEQGEIIFFTMDGNWAVPEFFGYSNKPGWSFPASFLTGDFQIFGKCSDSNCTNALNDYVLYYAARIPGAAQQMVYTASIIFEFHPHCPSGILDECGVCDGDGSACSCECYHGFHNEEMDHELMGWVLQNSEDPLDKTIEYYEKILAELERYHPGEQPASVDTLAEAALQKAVYVGEMGGCLGEYCSLMHNFTEDYRAVLPHVEKPKLARKRQCSVGRISHGTLVNK